MKKVKSNLPLKEDYKEKALEKRYRFTMNDGNFRGLIIHCPRMIREMKQNHNLGPLETLVLGQAYMAALIMAANLKEEGRIQIQIDCSGPVRGLSVEADNHGTVRGFLKQNPIPVEKDKKPDLAELFSDGILSVSRLEKMMKEPSTSSVNLRSGGNLGENLAYFYLQSEQIPSSFHLSIDFDREGNPAGSGALFLQVLPGAEKEDIIELEKRVTSLPSIGKAFSGGTQPMEFLSAHFGDMNPKKLDEGRVDFFCPCNRNKIAAFFNHIDSKEKKKMLKSEEFPIVSKCFNCSTEYHFEKDEIEKIFNKKRSKKK